MIIYIYIHNCIYIHNVLYIHIIIAENHPSSPKILIQWGFHQWGILQKDGSLSWNIPFKWMQILGTPMETFIYYLPSSMTIDKFIAEKVMISVIHYVLVCISGLVMLI